MVTGDTELHLSNMLYIAIIHLVIIGYLILKDKSVVTLKQVRDE